MPNPQVEHDGFDIPGSGTGPFTISPASALPPLSHPAVIDGTSQPGYSGTPEYCNQWRVPGVSGNGITLAHGSDGSKIIGLDIYGFASGAGIDIKSSSNVLQADFLGTNSTGTVAQGNQSGVKIDGGSGNFIGGPSYLWNAINYSRVSPAWEANWS